MEKVANATQLKGGLVCGEQGKQIKDKKKVEQKTYASPQRKC